MTRFTASSIVRLSPVGPTLARFGRFYSSPAAPSAMTATFNLPPKTSVHRYGSFAAGQALFKDVGWTMEERDRWAIVGSGKGRKNLIEVSGSEAAQATS